VPFKFTHKKLKSHKSITNNQSKKKVKEYVKGKGKSVPLQAWSVSEGSGN